MKKLPRPKYPKKYRKITPKMHRRILKLYEKGFTLKEIGKKFNVSYVTIQRRVNEEAHQRALEQTREWIKKRIKDPVYRKKINVAVNKNTNKRYHTDKKYNKYIRKYADSMRPARKDYFKQYQRERNLFKRNNALATKTKIATTKTKKNW